MKLKDVPVHTLFRRKDGESYVYVKYNDKEFQAVMQNCNGTWKFYDGGRVLARNYNDEECVLVTADIKDVARRFKDVAEGEGFLYCGNRCKKIPVVVLDFEKYNAIYIRDKCLAFIFDNDTVS